MTYFNCGLSLSLFLFFFFSFKDGLQPSVGGPRSIVPIDTTSKQGTENFATELNTGMEIPSSLSECAQQVNLG